MAPTALPPGFRFHPTDEELVAYYLKRKVHDQKMEMEVIPQVNLYKYEPWDLPEKSFLPGRDLEWYFFCPRDRKYPKGLRMSRATEAGYWKATGKDGKVCSHMRTIGRKKTLVFYRGRAPHGCRTDWVMREYRLEEKEFEGSASLQIFMQHTNYASDAFDKGTSSNADGKLQYPSGNFCGFAENNFSQANRSHPDNVSDGGRRKINMQAISRWFSI